VWEGLSEDKERKTNSDIHEMFFVDELFKNDLKFEKLMRKIERGYSSSSKFSLSIKSELSKKSQSGGSSKSFSETNSSGSSSSSSESDKDRGTDSKLHEIHEDYDEEDNFDSESFDDENEDL
jgi:hypothetical protein